MLSVRVFTSCSYSRLRYQVGNDTKYGGKLLGNRRAARNNKKKLVRYFFSQAPREPLVLVVASFHVSQSEKPFTSTLSFHRIESFIYV